MPKNKQTNEMEDRLAATIKRDKSYLLGLVSALALVVLLSAAVGYFAYRTYQKASVLFDAVDKTIVEKTGIDISEINNQPLEQAAAIASLKNTIYKLPARIRNPFLYEAFIYTEPATVAPTTTAPTSSKKL
jgi:hypothetical protein